MAKRKQSKGHPGKQDPRHLFFLNPYSDARFTSCPQCEAKTRIRKRPFVVHVDPMELLLLNMSGPYCPVCDLVILHKDRLESLLVAAFQQNKPALIGNNYLVVGTVDTAFWRKYKGKATLELLLENLHDFKQVVTFEPARWQWAPK
jgi:hypothetical protein